LPEPGNDEGNQDNGEKDDVQGIIRPAINADTMFSAPMAT